MTTKPTTAARKDERARMRQQAAIHPRALRVLLTLALAACSSGDQQFAPKPEEKVAVAASALTANGGACTANSQCNSNYCTSTSSGVCKAANGDTCSVASDCGSGICTSTKCVPRSGAGPTAGGYCSAVAACDDSNNCSVDACNTTVSGTVSTGVTMPPSVNVDVTQWAMAFPSAPNWICSTNATTTINTQTGALSGDTCGGTAILDATNGVTQSTSGGPTVMVIRLRGLSVTGNHIIDIVGDKPAIFLVAGNVTIDTGGRIDASATGTTAGPGGGSTSTPQSYCSGSTGTADTGSSGGGGGGFGSAGGTGGKSGGAGGGVSAGTNLQPLRGGCAGGTGGGGLAGGAGGGAFEISASGTITLGHSADTATTSGILSAAGGGSGATTGNNDGSSGGGSGGGILLVSPAAATFTTANAAARTHGGASGAARGLATGTAGEDGHYANDTPANGGNRGDINGANGSDGGLCSGNNCATTGNNDPGIAGSASAFVGAGGSGGGGRVQVITGTNAGTVKECAFSNAAAGATCRSAAGNCDVAETCSGSSTMCPSDTKASAGSAGSPTSCSPYFCDGSNAACPSSCTSDSNCIASYYCNGTTCAADQANGATCTSSSQCTSGNCVDGRCCNTACGGGVTTDCQACSTAAGAPSNGTCGTITAASNTVCRTMNGACDVAETCDGLSTACPGDGYASSSTTCRMAVGTCDIAENCTGSGTACPADTFKASTVVCRAFDSSGCDIAAENCTGSAANCPSDTVRAAGTSCRTATDLCDAAEVCDGSSNACPTDVLKSAGTTCRMSVGTCDVTETCTGGSAACPTDAFSPNTTLCRYQNGQCDAAEFCTGSSNACPGDAYAPLGTDCGYTGGPNSVTIYSTGLPSGTNANVQDIATSPAGYTTTGSNPTAATLQSTLATGWNTDAYKFATTAPASANYDYWRWVAGNGTASGSSRTLQTSDYIEYDVYIDSNSDGLGGIDIKTDHTSGATTGCSGSCDYFRGWSSWTDQNSIGGHPSSDISPRAYKKWYHRRLAIPSGLSGNTITYVDAVDENNSSGSRNAYYDNLMITQVAGACDGANACKVKDADRCAGNSDCASNFCQSQTLDANMTHRWMFAGSGTTVTDSIGGSGGNGTVTNTSLSGSGTVVLNGAQQSSNASAQYVSLPANLITSGTTNMSFEAWFVWSSSTNAWQRVFDFGSTTTNYLFVTPSNGSNSRVEYLRSGTTKYGVNGPILTTGVLTQIVVAYDDAANTITFYINGTSQGSVSLAGNTLANISDTNSWLGRSEFGTDMTLNGTIYEFRTYNKTLSAADVLASYRRGTEYSVCLTQLANGVACTSNNQCISTFCTDGVCCNSACGSGATSDCQACSVAAGAPSNGACATVTNTSTVCRTSQGTCDVAETCSGSSTSCPNDTQ